MEKKKIADSIIIRVGGGIREVYRKPVDIPEAIDSYNTESEGEKSEKITVLRSETGSVATNKKDEIIN
ncbi:MAG: hypothetical protein JRF02_04020 [Deltaproteobacteria bacterium]|nr:hypothetical protein [Deltaproteobacteria bacterium]